MKSLSAKTFQCGVTVQGLTTLSGTVYLTALTNTATWDYVVVGTTAQGQLYTRTYAQLMSDITSGIGLSGYVPTSRTLTINGVSYDLTANRSWTISTVDYTSRLQHVVKAGVAINKGQAVYVTSADGTNMIVGLASNASEATSSKTMGLLDATVSTNGFANVVTEGLLAGLDTSAAGTEGDPVWLGTGGNLIYGLINKPYAPAHLVFIGIVTRKNSNNGEIFVKVQNGFELKEIHDVDLITSAPTAGQLLRYNSDGLWKNWSPNYLTAEADTLATVTGRGATTNTSITVGPDLIVQADGSVNYTASRLWLNSHNNYRGAGVHMSGVGSTWFAGTPYTDFDGGYVIARTGTSNDVSSAQYSNALLTVKSSGNVGIGTSSPSHNLHLYGAGDRIIKIENTGTYLMYVGLLSNEGYIGSTNATPLGFYTNNVNRIYINTSGNVGIGTTSPASRFQSNNVSTYNSSTPTGAILASNLAGGNAVIDIGVDATYLGYIQSRNILNTTPYNLLLNPIGGNVGIGTTTTGSKLHVLLNGNTSGGPTGNVASFQNSSPGNNAYISLFGAYNAEAGIIFTDESEQYKGKIGYNNISEYMYFQTDGSEKVRITAAGNVGIGTTSPVSKLTVTNGNIEIQSDGSSSMTNYLKIGTHTGGSWGSYISASSFYNSNLNTNLRLGVSNSGTLIDVISITSVGDVGIGTTSPTAKLHVVGETKLTGASAAYTFFDQANATYYSVWYRNNNITYLYDSYLNSTPFVINSSGNVGIGTTSPVTNAAYNKVVHINSTSGLGAVLKLTDTTTGTAAADGFELLQYGVDSYLLNRENGRMLFYTNNNQRMVIDDGGNVGIGTASPTTLFHIHSTTADTILNVKSTVGQGQIRLDGAATDWSELNYFKAGTRTFGISVQHSVDKLFIHGASEVNNPFITVTNSGNVGIGTTSPGHPLEIYGGSMDPSLAAAGSSLLSINSLGVELAIGRMVTPPHSIWLQGKHATINDLTYPLVLNPLGGNVGIGNTSPSTLLDVSGVITATGGNSTNWNTAYGWGNHASASYVPQARTLTINGTSYDLSANRSWTITTTTAAGSDTQVQYNSSGSLAGASALIYNSTTNRVGINQASPGYDLDVNGQVRVQDKLRIGTGNGVVHMSSTATINASATTIVWAQNVSVGMCAFIEYYILNNNSLTDQRAGTIIVTWNQSGTPTITHTETTTPDIGSTVTVNFTSSLVGSDARINAVNSSANPYTMVMSYKYF
jgi:hypothetical protein